MNATRVLLIAIFTSQLVPVISAQAEPPLHEKETGAAWEAYRQGKFVEAIDHADNCIVEFHGVAARRQKEIIEKKEVVPNGKVTRAQEAAIHRNGVINDFAVAQYIKCRAAAKLGRHADSAKALAEVMKYPAARAWDPRFRIFWSITEAAELFRANPELADKALHEAFVALAWDALNRRHFVGAIENADKCVASFQVIALEMENDLAKQNVKIPVGAVDEQTKMTIFGNGVLNSTGTALFIRGKAAEVRGDKRAAIVAYTATLMLPHARCWDERGWFWSPAEAAGDRLAIIR